MIAHRAGLELKPTVCAYFMILLLSVICPAQANRLDVQGKHNPNQGLVVLKTEILTSTEPHGSGGAFCSLFGSKELKPSPSPEPWPSPTIVRNGPQRNVN